MFVIIELIMDKIAVMKKILHLFMLCLFVAITGCNLNTTSYTNVDAVNTVVDLSNVDYEIIGIVEGYSEQTYVFGIGGLSRKSLVDNAKADMYRNANLKEGEAIIYPSTTTSVTSYLVVQFVRAKANGYKIKMYRGLNQRQKTQDKVETTKQDSVIRKELSPVQEVKKREDSLEMSVNGRITQIRINEDCSFNVIRVSDKNKSVADFYIGEIEITQNVWNVVMYGKSGNKKVAVNNITIGEIKEFCRRLNEIAPSLASYKFCIPTEKQWELAAKGGDMSSELIYAGSDDISKVAWYALNTDDSYVVATKRPNELGIYDMSGGMSEICENSEKASMYEYVIRGGSIYDNSKQCKVCSRQEVEDLQANMKIGFRVALVEK